MLKSVFGIWELSKGKENLNLLNILNIAECIEPYMWTHSSTMSFKTF